MKLGSVLDVFDRRARLSWAALVMLTAFVSLLDGVGLTALIGGMKLVLDPDLLQRVPFGPALSRMLGIADEKALVLWVFGGLAAFYAVKNLVTALVFNASQRFIWNQRTRLCTRLLERYLRQSYVDHLAVSSAILQRNITSISRLCEYILVPALLMVADLVVIASLLAVILVFKPLMTLGLVVLLCLGGAIYLASRRRLALWGPVLEKSEADIIVQCQHAFSAFRDIRLYARMPFFARLFNATVDANSVTRTQFRILTNLPRLAMETALIGGLSLAMVVVVLNGQGITDFIPFAAALVAAATRMGPSINRVVQSAGDIRFGLASLDGIVQDLQAVTGAAVEPLPVLPVPFEHELVIESVGFRFPGSDAWALRNVNLRLVPGESIGIVGRSGSGKTTLAHILLGFLTPSEGRIRVDGVDVTDEPARWQPNVAFVPQEIFLLDDTLAANIAFGERPTDRSGERLRAAVEAASLAEIVTTLPDGLESAVGERGSRLSGGQRQRVAIARALYHGRRLLVLDEATAALDARTELEITRALERLHRRTTTVVIAHRLSTIRNCDRIVVLADGHVTETGSYDELMRGSRLFAELVAEPHAILG